MASAAVDGFASTGAEIHKIRIATKTMSEIIGELIAPARLMMTPGPCSIDPRVYRAMCTPLVGHMDPWFTEMVTTEVQVLLRRAFQTQNRITFPISASGSGGIE